MQLLPPDREVAHCTVADSAISIPDFKMVWVDIEAKKKSCKAKGGRLVLFVKKVVPFQYHNSVAAVAAVGMCCC